jgi:transposase InsO family protein
MNICPNAYYNYLKHAKSEYQQHKSAICNEIKFIYHELGGILGYRSMQVFLARKNISISRNTVHKYMNKQLQLQCICRHKKPGYRKGHAHKIFSNLLNQNFKVEKANRVWCTDFTYLFLSNGAMRFNCTIIDLFDRSVVASENGRWMTSDLAIQTLKKALQTTGCNSHNLIIHSDQGSQFTSLEFILFCKDQGITQSMSHAGCPYDNAPMERYYNTLKAELINQYSFRTDEELDYSIFEFAYHWYNQIRPHSYNDYKTPFERRYGLE